MEEFQRIGDRLAQAINEGDVEEATRLMQEAMGLDAEFEVICEQAVDEHIEEVKEAVLPGGQKSSEIYEKLIEMGVERDKALKLAGNCKSIDEAINNAFN